MLQPLLLILSLLIVSILVFVFSRWFYNRRLFKLYKKIKDNRAFINSIEEQLEYPQTVTFKQVDQEIDALLSERRAEIDRLHQLETYRKEYLGNVSHELKTPIFNIQGYLSTLLDGGLEDETINRDYIQRAENGVERMIGIVEDLESITQLEAGQLEPDFETFDIRLLTTELFKAHELKALNKKIQLSFKDGDTKSVLVYADKFRIRQVLTNLIVNSIKYGKEGGETRIGFYDVGDNMRIEVADNGYGIGEKHLPRLFERFYRVDKHRSREQGGTGLGLAIVKHILEAHGQSINVMSTEGVGSVFSFTLKKG